jgi:antitoxin MazE
MRQTGNRDQGRKGPVARVSLVKMGSSRGVRLPRLFLEEADLDEEVEMEVQEDQVIIRLVPRPRRNWEKEFEGMTARGDNRLLDPKAFSLTAWDEEKWVW